MASTIMLNGKMVTVSIFRVPERDTITSIEIDGEVFGDIYIDDDTIYGSHLEMFNNKYTIYRKMQIKSLELLPYIMSTAHKIYYFQQATANVTQKGDVSCDVNVHNAFLKIGDNIDQTVIGNCLTLKLK
jgi:hypothetical protein